jgi:hypothetical protein
MEVYYGIILSTERYYTNLARNSFSEVPEDFLTTYVFDIHKEQNIDLKITDESQIYRDPIKFLMKNPYKIDFIPYYENLKLVYIDDGYSVLLGYELDLEDYKILPIEDVLTPEIKAKVIQELRFNNIRGNPDIYLFKVKGKDRLQYRGFV